MYYYEYKRKRIVKRESFKFSTSVSKFNLSKRSWE